MSLGLTKAQMMAIYEHGERAYPHECCGLLLGRFDQDDQKTLVETWAVENNWEGSGEFGLDDGQTSQRRFMISPDNYRQGERHARSKGLEVIGTYHSHPDHPAIPSEFDRNNAWPVYSYMIVSVEQGKAKVITSWTLDDDRQFQNEAFFQATEV
jgi:proteasome lid subunit RPN8/RPN11